MFKKVFWIASILALIYVLAWENVGETLSHYQYTELRKPARMDEDFISNGTVYQFKVDHCQHSVSTIKQISGTEHDSLIREMTKIKQDKGTSVENKNNVFYPVNNCVSVFLSNSLMQAEGFRNSVK